MERDFGSLFLPFAMREKGRGLRVQWYFSDAL
jgi:hypothetical protein